MKRVLILFLLTFATLSAVAADTDRKAPAPISIATTGRIAAIDLTNKLFKVRSGENGSDLQSGDSKQILSPKITFGTGSLHIHSAGGVTLPGGIHIQLPGRTPKSPRAIPDGPLTSAEYTVLISNKTVLQDGADTIQLEDFKVGETISIRGVLSGQTLTASRVAKWPTDGADAH